MLCLRGHASVPSVDQCHILQQKFESHWLWYSNRSCFWTWPRTRGRVAALKGMARDKIKCFHEHSGKLCNADSFIKPLIFISAISGPHLRALIRPGCKNNSSAEGLIDNSGMTSRLDAMYMKPDWHHKNAADLIENSGRGHLEI